MSLGRPKAETASVLGHQHGVFGPQFGGGLQPLVGVEIDGIECVRVRMRTVFPPVVVGFVHLHVEMDQHADLRIGPVLLDIVRADDIRSGRPATHGQQDGNDREPANK